MTELRRHIIEKLHLGPSNMPQLLVGILPDRRSQAYNEVYAMVDEGLIERIDEGIKTPWFTYRLAQQNCKSA